MEKKTQYSYVNMLRDPISRVKSLFYYEREWWGVFPKDYTFETCLKDGICTGNVSLSDLINPITRVKHKQVKDGNSRFQFILLLCL